MSDFTSDSTSISTYLKFGALFKATGKHNKAIHLYNTVIE